MTPQLYNVIRLQERIRQDVPKAIYSPCNAHKLNLVIAYASKLMQIKNCVGVVNETYLFFKLKRHQSGNDFLNTS